MQIRAASVMESAQDEAKIALDRAKRPQRNHNNERLKPVNKYSSLEITGRSRI